MDAAADYIPKCDDSRLACGFSSNFFDKCSCAAATDAGVQACSAQLAKFKLFAGCQFRGPNFGFSCLENGLVKCEFVALPEARMTFRPRPARNLACVSSPQIHKVYFKISTMVGPIKQEIPIVAYRSMNSVSRYVRYPFHRMIGQRYSIYLHCTRSVGSKLDCGSIRRKDRIKVIAFACGDLGWNASPFRRHCENLRRPMTV